METEEKLKKMHLHESLVFPIEGKNTPVKDVLVTKVIGGWIYMIGYGNNSEPPVFVPEIS